MTELEKPPGRSPTSAPRESTNEVHAAHSTFHPSRGETSAPRESIGLDPLSRLVYELSKLPGIGSKTATRLAYHILKQDKGAAAALAEAILVAKERIGLCSRCYSFTDADPCRICARTDRDAGVICVVERPADAHSIEQAGVYRGVYHVLHGALSPLSGVGPDDLKIRELLERLGPATRELILATNPSVEGEMTLHFIEEKVRAKAPNLKITRLASGIPAGGLIQYSDRATLGRAIGNRFEVRGA